MAIPDPQAEMRKNTAATISIDLRPKRSERLPAKKAPTAHPKSMEATLNPLPIFSALKADSNPFTVPLMTPLSKPKRKPPRAATTDIKMMNKLFSFVCVLKMLLN